MAKQIDYHIEYEGDTIRLYRNQWGNNFAYISNYPGLLDEVVKYTWTYSKGKHPYLNCGKLNGISLHRFVLDFLYGKDKTDEMLGKENIIEHLDNNGLNCTYENLHILSDDMNKAKAFSVDKRNEELKSGKIVDIPAFTTDVFYSHSKKCFQLQIFFNKNIVYNVQDERYVESFIFQYDTFDTLFIDWLYCFECLKKGQFDFDKHHADRAFFTNAIPVLLNENEKDALFVKRDGKILMVIRTDPDKGPISFVEHTSYKEIEEDKK